MNATGSANKCVPSCPSPLVGDYSNISAVNGMIRPIWMAYDGNLLSIWTAIVTEDMFKQ